ncbi:MAG: ACP S-malonyltransferase [Candidatus Pelagibacter bacterium]|jgi:[acyl-carrier-protein] S-malonyltransferase|nr:ACP S-malonyltransferase [Candidatus Pelagibacter bacterium]
MFSVIFPGQGSQSVGMANNLYNSYSYIKELFDEADEILGFSLSKIITNGPKEKLDQTENTQPAIFLVSYSIFEMLKREAGLDLGKAKYFAGHSLGEYSALTASRSLDFDRAIKLLKIRGNAMQSAVPKGEGGMLAVLGTEINIISDLLKENQKKYECFIANDNSNGQLVLSGRNKDLDLLVEDLKKKAIKNIKLPVSAPFHCKLMSSATEIMRKEIANTEFKNPNNIIISNVTGEETNNPNQIKDLLIKQIESPVRWRESISYIINKGVRNFIEIGPGKVLSGLIKRIDKSVNLISVNEINDLKNINLND